MKAMRMAFCAVVLGFVPGAALADAWHGLWAADPAWCANADKIGAVETAPIRMTEKRIEGYENACSVKSASQIGNKEAWHVVVECVAEGARYDEHSILIIGGNDRLWRWFGAGDPVAFTRCPG